jgi:hypothetical protein
VLPGPLWPFGRAVRSGVTTCLARGQQRRAANASRRSDALDEDEFFEAGTTTQQCIGDSRCAEGDVQIASQDANGHQEVSVNGGMVGVCRHSPEQIASGVLAGTSVLAGWYAPLSSRDREPCSRRRYKPAGP